MSEDLISDVFGPSGLISRFHENYEHREEQIKMAEEIVRAFADKKHLIVEAGTGTGKTMAYLVPAIAAAIGQKKRIVVSTGTKNLQEQLMEKDIPFLKKILPAKFSASYMKGRSNYACIYRVHKAEHQPILDGLDQMDHFRKISRWVPETETGDRRELVDLPENLSFWNRINARGEVCIGQKCPDFDPCFITRMRSRADKAEIVVVNHHLFFADLSVRGNQFGKVIPDYGAVIFDEAHLIEDIAADYFGFEVSNFQIDELARDIDNLPIFDPLSTRDLTKLAARIIGLSEQFWLRFSQAKQEGRYPLMQEVFFNRRSDSVTQATPLGEAYTALDNALGTLETVLEKFATEMAEAESLLRRTRQARFDMEFIVTQAEKNFVYWLERRGRGIYIHASPVDVSELLREKLFDKVESCILTSATLSASGSFNFVRERLGLDAANTRSFTAQSSFDFEKQAILYLPKAMPDPRSAEFSQMAAGEIVKLLGLSRGHAFVLCTSNYSMNALYQLVSSRINYPCFVQGSTSKAALLERFRETPNAVLFATSSFWQGVDVQGDQLSCVIIDKLPFAVPSDPIVAARSKFIDENGGRSFMDYSVPQAVITLKQGIGRLIRSRTDRGVIAILDPRIRTKPYGRTFLESLPRMRITNNLSDVGSILGYTSSE